MAGPEIISARLETIPGPLNIQLIPSAFPKKRTPIEAHEYNYRRSTAQQPLNIRAELSAWLEAEKGRAPLSDRETVH
jgi:hypothetical protein